MPLYPGFNRHLDHLTYGEIHESENLTKLRDFIKSVSKTRVKKAKIMIDDYHQQSEDAVKKEISKFTVNNNK